MPSGTNSTLADLPAYEFTATYDTSAGQGKIKEIGIIKDGNGYYVRYMDNSDTYSKSLPDVDSMISAFKLKK